MGRESRQRTHRFDTVEEIRRESQVVLDQLTEEQFQGGSCALLSKVTTSKGMMANFKSGVFSASHRYSPGTF